MAKYEWNLHLLGWLSASVIPLELVDFASGKAWHPFVSVYMALRDWCFKHQHQSHGVAQLRLSSHYACLLFWSQHPRCKLDLPKIHWSYQAEFTTLMYGWDWVRTRISIMPDLMTSFRQLVARNPDRLAPIRGTAEPPPDFVVDPRIRQRAQSAWGPTLHPLHPYERDPPLGYLANLQLFNDDRFAEWVEALTEQVALPKWFKGQPAQWQWSDITPSSLKPRVMQADIRAKLDRRIAVGQLCFAIQKQLDQECKSLWPDMCYKCHYCRSTMKPDLAEKAA